MKSKSIHAATARKENTKSKPDQNTLDKDLERSAQRISTYAEANAGIFDSFFQHPSGEEFLGPLAGEIKQPLSGSKRST